MRFCKTATTCWFIGAILSSAFTIYAILNDRPYHAAIQGIMTGILLTLVIVSIWDEGDKP